MNSSHSILSDYEDKAVLYEALSKKICVVLEGAVQEENLYVHSIHYRVKERASLSRKLNGLEASYNELGDLTDIAGVRVITYFSSDVERVADIIQRQFSIDTKNCIDKATLLDPDRFGYLSLHYVVSLKKACTKPSEYRRFRKLKAEIQIRSILQHAWAEIEHDMGYKSKHAIPIHMRRRFSRLSGLLELADHEFDVLRENLREYSDEIAATQDTDKPIDKISLSNFIKRNAFVRMLDEKIQNQTGFELVFEEWFAELLVDKLLFVGVTELSDLEYSMEGRSDVIKDFAIDHLKGRSYTRIHRGVSIYYFCTGLLAETGDEKSVREYLETFGLGGSNNRQKFARGIIAKYKTVSHGDASNK
jgi:ppGpp synthetase/RelA/SpoT-type nucleotidyltranferase